MAGEVHEAKAASSRLHSNVDCSDAVNVNVADVEAGSGVSDVIVVCGGVVSGAIESSTSTSSKDASRSQKSSHSAPALRSNEADRVPAGATRSPVN